MKIQGHTLLSVAPVQPQREVHKSGDPRDGGFARQLSERQSSAMRPERQSSAMGPERQSSAMAPERQSNPMAPERQPNPKAHDAAHPPYAAQAPTSAPHKERTASDRPGEASPGNDQNAAAQGPADADGATNAAATATAKLRGQARAQGTNSCARHPATDAGRAAHSGQDEQRADTATDALAQPGAAEEAQVQPTDPMLAQWLATLALPAAPLPAAINRSGTIDAQTASTAGGLPQGAESPPAAPGLSVSDAAPKLSSKAAAAGVGLAAGLGAGEEAGTVSSTATDVGAGSAGLPVEPAAAVSTIASAASSLSQRRAGADAAEGDRLGTGDATTAQLASQSAVQALARDQSLLATGAAERRPAGIDGITATAGMALAPVTPGTPLPREATAATPVVLATPVASPDFQQALAVQVSVLARGGVQHAELHLHPADMGPVSVRIALDGTLARVEFGADLAATRQAIETGLPELASALRDAGLTLSGGGVSQHSRGRGDANQERAQGEAGAARRPSAADGEAAARPIRRTVRAGGVDLFA